MKPLLKWVGGKRWLVPILKEIWEPHQSRRLVEPFTGGMSVALGLNPDAALLNDANTHLMNFYQQVQKGLKFKNQFKNNSEFYYAVRDEFNSLIKKRKHKTKTAASFFYYLIRTGYNGLCRFNENGEYNVPFGQHKTINYKMDFLEYKEVLKKWELKQLDFESLTLDDKDFLYADPPYDVEFTRYNAKDFLWKDQVRLAKWLSKHFRVRSLHQIKLQKESLSFIRN